MIRGSDFFGQSGDRFYEVQCDHAPWTILPRDADWYAYMWYDATMLLAGLFPFLLDEFRRKSL